MVFSNCAVPFRNDVLDVLKARSDQVVVHCSDYGVRPEVSEQNLKQLAAAHIPHKYLKYYGDGQYCDGWVDNGDFVPHHRTDEENERIFSACSHVCRGGSWYVRNGQMHWCGRSIRGAELGKIPLRKEDYLDIFDSATTLEEKRKKVGSVDASAYDYCLRLLQWGLWNGGCRQAPSRWGAANMLKLLFIGADAVCPDYIFNKPEEYPNLTRLARCGASASYSAYVQEGLS